MTFKTPGLLEMLIGNLRGAALRLRTGSGSVDASFEESLLLLLLVESAWILVLTLHVFIIIS